MCFDIYYCYADVKEFALIYIHFKSIYTYLKVKSALDFQNMYIFILKEYISTQILLYQHT